MELNTIKDAFDRVVKKQKLSSSKSEDVIEQVRQEIEQSLLRMQSPVGTMSQPDKKLLLTKLKTKLKEMSPVSQIENPQTELSVSLNKYPKILEKSFNPDISKAYRNVDFDVHAVNHILASHFYREGLFDIGDCFIEEAHEPECADKKSPFVKMYRLLKAMRSGDLEPALEWAATNREKLNQSGSSIELKLRRLQFIDILQKRGRDEALKYCRKYMTPCAHLCMPDIQKLMACLLWAGKLESSPYYEFFSPHHEEKLTEELAQQYCKLLGQSYESPLTTTIAAGVQGLPSLLKLMNVMTGKKAGMAIYEALTCATGFGQRPSISFHLHLSSKPGPGHRCCYYVDMCSASSLSQNCQRTIVHDHLNVLTAHLRSKWHSVGSCFSDVYSECSAGC